MRVIGRVLAQWDCRTAHCFALPSPFRPECAARVRRPEAPPRQSRISDASGKSQAVDRQVIDCKVFLSQDLLCSHSQRLLTFQPASLVIACWMLQTQILIYKILA